MKEKIAAFVRIPPEIREEFWQEVLGGNRLSLTVICGMIFGMELYNMARVVFWSSAGLGTLNNRIYFSFYLILTLAAAGYLAARWLLRGARPGTRWAVQYGAVLFFLAWHVCINAYDLHRDPGSESGIYLTAVLAMAVFIRMPARYSLIAYAGGYALFTLLAGPNLSDGSRLNLTFTTIVSLAASLTHCRHTVVELVQRREIRQINRQLHALLEKDPLTGARNQAAFYSRGEELLRQGPAAMLIVDMDSFKEINDRFGHPCGDFVLKETARILREVFPPEAHVGRIGGDEFAAALPLPEKGETLEELGERVIRQVTGIAWRGREVGACCSVGICRAPRGCGSYDQLYRLADQALYRAKREGKGRCCAEEI